MLLIGEADESFDYAHNSQNDLLALAGWKEHIQTGNPSSSFDGLYELLVNRVEVGASSFDCRLEVYRIIRLAAKSTRKCPSAFHQIKMNLNPADTALPEPVVN